MRIAVSGSHRVGKSTLVEHLFDRCPVDILAYLLVHDDADAFVVDRWLERIEAAMQTIDLVVLVPIEEEDRIALSPDEDRTQRSAVDEKLHELLIDDALGFERDVLIVRGDVRARVEQVLDRCSKAS